MVEEHAPVVFALSASFTFALAAHIQNLGLRDGDWRTATLIIMATTAGLYWLAAPFIIAPSYWWTGACGLFVLAGLFRPALSISFWVKGIQMLGPTLNATLSAGSPLFAAMFGILLLGESMTLPVALGTLAVFAGALAAAWRPGGTKLDWPMWAVLLPLAATFLRNIAHAITKIGFEEVPSPLFAGLVSTTVSLVLVGAYFFAQGVRCDLPRRDIGLLVLSGALNALAVYLLNAALSVGKLIVVAPILAVSPVFAMMLSLLVFRRDVITWRKVLTLCLVVPGVILVILSG